MSNRKIIEKDIAIIGAGPVGMFSVFEAGMLSLSTCLIDGNNQLGGQCSILYPEKYIYDIPAIPKITGQHLIDQIKEQISIFKPEILLGQKINIIKQDDDKFQLLSKDYIIKAKSIIIATGGGTLEPNKPPLENIKNYENKDIFYSVQNKHDFKNKIVTVAGAGDSATDWAIELANIAKKVNIVHRRTKMRCTMANEKKIHDLSSKGLIDLFLGYQLEKLHGETELESISIKDLDNNIKMIETDALLPFFGLKNNNNYLELWNLKLHEGKIFVTEKDMQTSTKGIFAIGDIAYYENKLKLIMTGFAESAKAMRGAYEFIFGTQPRFQHSTDMKIK